METIKIDMETPKTLPIMETPILPMETPPRPWLPTRCVTSGASSGSWPSPPGETRRVSDVSRGVIVPFKRLKEVPKHGWFIQENPNLEMDDD